MATPIESFLTYDPAPAVPDGRRTVTFLPEPEKRRRLHTIISVDDHTVEPPDTFEGRVARKYADRARKVISTPNGGQAWLYDDKVLPNVGFNAVVRSRWASWPLSWRARFSSLTANRPVLGREKLIRSVLPRSASRA
jgi:hypothetical protein